MIDESNGYDSIADIFIKGRGQAVNGIGSSIARTWAQSFDKGSTLLDIGCGTGIPITKILLEEGLNAYALDASPKMIGAFRRNFPNIPVACESAEESLFFNRSFDGIISVGLIFLLSEQTQRVLVAKMAAALNPGGRLLFTAPPNKIEWKDAMTEQLSVSLGAEQYRELISSSGLSVVEELEDEGENHYYQAIL